MYVKIIPDVLGLRFSFLCQDIFLVVDVSIVHTLCRLYSYCRLSGLFTRLRKTNSMMKLKYVRSLCTLPAMVDVIARAIQHYMECTH